jgi:RHS repeat-associated protein
VIRSYRLTNAANSLWSETYGYDGFGNLTSKSGSGGSPNAAPSMTATYNANNQQVGVSYDANGNPINGGWNSFTMENKLNMESSTYFPYPVSAYGYDPWGKRVMKYTNPDPDDDNGQWNPAWEFYFYTITGQKLVTMDCNNPNNNPAPSCWVAGENVYFGKKLLVSNGVYVVTDRLGTVRANTQGESFAYYPYGEERTNTVNDREKFATYLRDGVGQDYADQRYYNSGTGRFWTVDPGGIKTADSGVPLSWNRYAYVNGDPVNFLDRHGLEEQAPDDGGCDPNLDCGPPECYDPSNEFLGQPDPGCLTGGGGSGETTTTSAPPAPMECEADLYNRPVQYPWLYALTGATHSYWEVEEYNPNTTTTVFDIVISGLPNNVKNPSTGKSQTYINVYTNPPGTQPDPGSGQAGSGLYFSTGMSASNCDGVLGALAVAFSWPINSIPYSLSFNSNTVAHIMAGILGYANMQAPPGAFGWNGGN